MNDRLPPHSVEAEKGVIGCILQMDPKDIAACVGNPEETPSPDEFYDLRHAGIIERIGSMISSGQQVDMVTLVSSLSTTGHLEGFGGMTYLSELLTTSPSPANLPYYTAIVREKAMLRQAIQACGEIINEAYTSENGSALIDDAEKKILGIRKREGNAIRPMREHVNVVIDTIETIAAGGSVGIATGFQRYDKFTRGGLRNGTLLVIAARPSAGKTTIAMNMAVNIAKQFKEEWLASHLPTEPYKGKTVGVFSLEMKAPDLVERMICAESGVSTTNPFFTELDHHKLCNASAEIATIPIVIDDSSGIPATTIRAKARRMKQRYNCSVIVVDYLGLIASDRTLRTSDRRVQVDAMSTAMKEMARELDVPVILLTQMNREIEKGAKRKPKLSDLRESGQIEQDADIVCFLYLKNDDDASSPIRDVMFLIAKQRNGPSGIDIPLKLHAPITKFESISPVEK